MRYFTREWYQWCQWEYIPLRACAGAAEFSEAYYRRLYRRRLRAFLNDMRQGWELDMAEDQATAPWDEPHWRGVFEDWHRDRIQDLQAFLPGDILNQVADIRVLELGLATPQVKAAVVRHCSWNERRVEQTLREYGQHLAALRAKYSNPFLEKLSFHDWLIRRLDPQPDRLEMQLEDVFGEEGDVRITMEDCRILRMDEQVPGADWLYEEIHQADRGFEIHMLCYNRNFEEPLGEMIVQCSDAIIEACDPSAP